MKIAAFLLLMLYQIVYGRSTNYEILAGNRVNEISLKKLTPKDVRKITPVVYEKNCGNGIMCFRRRSRRYELTVHYNDSIGLSFKFKHTIVKWPFRFMHKPKLTSITALHGFTSYNLVIGVSSRQEVLNALGQP